MKQKIFLLPATATCAPFADEEARQHRLALLLKVQQLTDHAVSEVIQRETRKGKTFACARGCASCRRTHNDIPVYPLELMVSLGTPPKNQKHHRARVQLQLQQHGDNATCPFLERVRTPMCAGRRCLPHTA